MVVLKFGGHHSLEMKAIGGVLNLENHNNNILFTSEGNLRGGSGPIMITPTRWCGMSAPWSYKFRIVFITFHRTSFAGTLWAREKPWV